MSADPPTRRAAARREHLAVGAARGVLAGLDAGRKRTENLLLREINVLKGIVEEIM
jgi:hypothetical protein